MLLAFLQLGSALARPLSFFGRRKFEGRYRESLESWAEGQTEEALASLVALEEETAGGDSDALESIHKTKLRLARRLARSATGALEGIALFQEAFYRRLREEGHREAAVYARETLVELGLEYASRAESERDIEAAARLLSRVGRDLLASHVEGTAEALLEEAAALSHEEAEARLCLAWSREKRGRYDDAVRALRHLDEASPGHREGRLRRAINLGRTGAEVAAEEELRELSEEGPWDWIRSLAVQERVRLLAAAGELEEVRALLERARRALPCDLSLAVQNAFLSEVGGLLDPGEPLDVILRRCAGGESVSPRDLYNRLPPRCAPAPPGAGEIEGGRRYLAAALEASR